ncbi:hypothetical protein [uncultured Jannaschia sp.]|uniref:hypothetical protein n=1 Tax=uncultured Jannaschia sp. TaxID=293347 RepID=UPI0026385371|nr:hypothetical protein [uncultured Jannaschia sp.]
MQDDFDLAYLSVGEEWDKAESAIKLAEQVNREVVSPAIYELRYAGRKLVEAKQLRLPDPAKSLDLLRDAKMDCLRARHDAIDAATSKIVMDLEIAVSNLGATRVLSCFPNWSDVYGQLVQVRSKIAVSREDRNNRDAIYSTIQGTDLPAIVKLYNAFKAQEPHLIRDAKKERWTAVGGYVVGAIGIVIGVIGIL